MARVASPGRRRFLRGAGALGVGLVGGPFVLVSEARAAGADDFGPLGAADPNGLRLPPGFTSRVVAVADQMPAPASAYAWPRLPDGGAVFETGDGGWIYVANSEVGGTNGGVGALRFDAGGEVVDAYSILTGTRRNCAGGATPWDTWLSCEETAAGRVWECDPFSPSQGVARDAMGVFMHEAAAVDPVARRIYLTEDQTDGLLYRFTPDAYPDLSTGLLEAAEVLGPGAIQPGQVRALAWHALVNPTPANGGVADPSHPVVSERSTRYQLPSAAPFAGGEGCFWHAGVVHFTSKGDDRVWALDTAADSLEIVYDHATSSDPELSGVDNVFTSRLGDIYVAEDGGDMQIVALTPSGDVKPILQLEGQDGSEITGPALSPDGLRLYFSSQRGPTPTGDRGITYEVAGPFAPRPRAPSLAPLGRGVVGVALALAASLALRRASDGGAGGERSGGAGSG